MATDKLSRFKNTEPIIEDGHETYGLWKEFKFLKTRPKDKDIGTYRVTSSTEGRPDLIAYALYGTVELYWVLLAFNGIIETLGWPKTGTSIEYPIDNIVLPELL